jgi:hypothetical protein
VDAGDARYTIEVHITSCDRVVVAVGLHCDYGAAVPNHLSKHHGHHSLVCTEVKYPCSRFETRQRELLKFGKLWPVTVIPGLG